MRTRCSSMPSAETLVKPAGSTRVTLAVSGAPPQPSTVACGPLAHLDRIDRENSTTSSRLSGSPISTSGVPASDHPFAFLDEPQHPAAHGCAHSHAAADRHLALPGLLRADQPRLRALQFALAHVEIGLGPRQGRLPGVDVDARPLQRALGDGLGCIRACARLSSLWANSSSDSRLVDFGLGQRHGGLARLDLRLELAQWCGRRGRAAPSAR